jgi:hypothetical protein
MPPLVLAQAASPYQVAAWQAAVVGAILAIIQLALGLWKQRRDIRVERAKFGYGLLDRSSDLLYALDNSFENSGRRKGKMTALAGDFVTIFRDKGSLHVDRSSDVYARLDALLYFCDRFEHAIESGLTTFDVVRTPTAYYVKILSQFKAALVPYITAVGYSRVLTFLNRFQGEWNQRPSSNWSQRRSDTRAPRLSCSR